MPLIANFSSSQPLGEPNIVTLTDTSTGSDGAVTQRRVYLRDFVGNDVLPVGVTGYVEWDYADTSIDIDCLTKDFALTVTVEWLNASNVVLYDKVDVVGFSSYNEDFLYSLVQMLSANPNRVKDNGFMSNMSDLRTYLDSGNKALERYGDIYICQQCYDKATDMRINSVTLFNLV